MIFLYIMELVSKYSFEWLSLNLIGKTIRFKSDCEFFPNFDVNMKVSSIYLKNNEIIFEGKVKHKNNFIIGANMKNLSFEIL